MLISCPSKTFLVGEYLALSGGPSLLMSTTPRFQLKVSLAQELIINFHKDSPAGKLAFEKLHKNNVNLNFMDPYDGSGGFGASGAQFLLVSAYIHKINNQKLDLKKVWNDFRELYDGEAFTPSGMDIISQYSGGISEITFSTEDIKVNQFDWPFEKQSLLFFKTHQITNTHEHLSGLDLEKITTCLKPFAADVIKSFKEKSIEGFSKGVTEYYNELVELDLITDKTKELVAEFSSREGVLAIKGCGALGSDVIAVFCDSDKGHYLMPELKSLGLEFISSDHSVSEGLRYDDLDS